MNIIRPRGGGRRRGVKTAVVGLLTGLVLLSGCSSEESKRITRADYGDDWPLTVSSATIHCERIDSQRVPVWIEVGGEKFAINGTAHTYLGEPTSGTDAIWKIRGFSLDKSQTWRISLHPLIDTGLALCNAK